MSIAPKQEGLQILRVASHQCKDTTIDILINLRTGNFFVLDSEGWFEASKDFKSEHECYKYINAVYGVDYE